MKAAAAGEISREARRPAKATAPLARGDATQQARFLIGGTKMMKSIGGVLAVALAAVGFGAGAFLGTTTAWAQQSGADTAKQIVGVWRLVSAMNTGADGVPRVGSFGPDPKGMIIFTASGHYAVVNTHPDIPKFASGNRLQGTPEEYKAVVQGSNSSFGTYSVSPDGKVLTLRIEGGTWAHWNGTEQNRDLTLTGDDMKYSLAASRGGRSELAFKRVK